MANAKKRSGPAKKAAAKKRTAAPETVLVGDVGGTRTRLALYAKGAKKAAAESIVPSGEHAGLEEIVTAFLEGTGARPSAAVFGVAGPVRAGTAQITNLPWKLDERALARKLRIPRVRLANDLVVGARGCLEVRASEITLITDKAPAKKGEHLGVVAAGTGLGEARLVWIDGRYHALATEGGHCDFAPRSPLEVDLWHFLAARFPEHVSYERVVSGAGLGVIYDFFAAREKEPVPAAIAARLAAGDRNAAICDLGIEGAHRPAALAVDLFARIYGAECGNVALRELATGGVYVIGNIGSIIIPARRQIFLEGFLAKGRFAGLLATVPVAVVRDPLVGLRGARALAEELSADA